MTDVNLRFYNPSVYKAPQRRELTEEERIYVQSGPAHFGSLRLRIAGPWNIDEF